MGGPGAQYWGTEELVAKTGYLVCELSTAPNSFSTSPRLSQMAVSCTRTRHAKCGTTKAHNHLGAPGGRKARVGQQTPEGDASQELERAPLNPSFAP